MNFLIFAAATEAQWNNLFLFILACFCYRWWKFNQAVKKHAPDAAKAAGGLAAKAAGRVYQDHGASIAKAIFGGIFKR